MRKLTTSSVSVSLILILILAQFSGCSRTVKELRESDQTVIFAAKEPYQTVYKKIVEQARQCYQIGATAGHFVVQGDLYSDVRKGVVTIARTERITASVRNDISADIEAVSDNLTRVTVYHDGAHRFIAENMAQWVTFGSTNCKRTE
jgi:hypothetical protein